MKNGAATIHRIRVLALVVLLSCTLVGCASDTPLNPSFPLTHDVAAASIRQMNSDRVGLPRPVIVLGGIHDPGLVAPHVADVIRDTALDRTRIVHVSFFETGSFDSCAHKLIRRIEAAFPCSEHAQTIEVDVVAFSMGGLVARHAASDDYAARRGKRLRIARLFTISTPHQGAALARLPTLDRRVKDMQAGSPFLARLNGERGDYPIFAYVRLRDGIVGEQHAAPPCVDLSWVPSGLTFSHLMAGFDQRILADILRRLRGEEPLSTAPAAALP